MKTALPAGMPIFSPDDEKLIEKTTSDTVTALNTVASTNLPQALAMAIGTIFGVMHFMRALGLVSYGVQLFKEMLKEMRKPK